MKGSIFHRLPNKPVTSVNPHPLVNMSADVDSDGKVVFTPNPVVKLSMAADYSVTELALMGNVQKSLPARRTSKDIVAFDNLHF